MGGEDAGPCLPWALPLVPGSLAESLAHEAASVSRRQHEEPRERWLASVTGGTSGPCSLCSVQDPTSSLHITWPLGSSGPMWPYTYLPDFLAGRRRTSHFSASEITWGSGCSPPTWCLYDIKLKVCATGPEVWGCLGYIACWHSIKKCVRWRKLILMQSCPYCWLGWILKVTYPLNQTKDFPWGWLTGAPQERGAHKKIILTRLQ